MHLRSKPKRIHMGHSSANRTMIRRVRMVTEPRSRFTDDQRVRLSRLVGTWRTRRDLSARKRGPNPPSASVGPSSRTPPGAPDVRLGPPGGYARFGRLLPVQENRRSLDSTQVRHVLPWYVRLPSYGLDQGRLFERLDPWSPQAGTPFMQQFPTGSTSSSRWAIGCGGC